MSTYARVPVRGRHGHPLAAIAIPALLAWALIGCAPAPLRTGIESEWAPSDNFDARRPNFVILHHTGSGGLHNALKTLTRRDGQVSSHYLIGRHGQIYQLVDERARAWHAGESDWGGNTDLNSSSIGIELDNDGLEPFPEPQILALLALLGDIAERHKIPSPNYLGHGDIAPGRKVDPSRHFPWRRLAEQGFGLWCDAPSPVVATPQYDHRIALQALGYDITDPSAAVAAFKRHFAPNDPDPSFTPENRSLLHCLLEQRDSLRQPRSDRSGEPQGHRRPNQDHPGPGGTISAEQQDKGLLVVTHAGLNTTLDALSTGLPMVAIPVTNDQPGIAARIAWVGAGEMVMLSQATPRRLRSLISRVLSGPPYTAAAQRVRDAIQIATGARVPRK